MKKIKGEYVLIIPVIEKRLVECDYSFTSENIEDVKRVLENVKKNPLEIDEYSGFEVEDVEILKSSAVEVYPEKADIFYNESGKQMWFIKTVNGVVDEMYKASEKYILEQLKEYYDGMSEEEKELIAWDEVEEDMELTFYNKYGELVVAQGVEE